MAWLSWEEEEEERREDGMADLVLFYHPLGSDQTCRQGNVVSSRHGSHLLSSLRTDEPSSQMIFYLQKQLDSMKAEEVKRCREACPTCWLVLRMPSAAGFCIYLSSWRKADHWRSWERAACYYNNNQPCECRDPTIHLRSNRCVKHSCCSWVFLRSRQVIALRWHPVVAAAMFLSETEAPKSSRGYEGERGK